jgi:hypothetical protein
MCFDILMEGLCDLDWFETAVEISDGKGVSEWKRLEAVDDDKAENEGGGARNEREADFRLDVSGCISFVFVILVFEDGSGAKVSVLRAGIVFDFSLLK